MEPMEPLSRREKDVIAQLLEGKSNKQIASALHITERTVEFHLKNIFAKYQVSSRTELILKLGESTVANEGGGVENGDSSNDRHWTAALREAVSKFGKELKVTSVTSSIPQADGAPMTFFESLRVCLTRYADFNGRASRSEFWWFALFVTLATSALSMIHETLGGVFLIAVLLPLLAAGTRRLHDTGRSGWWELYLLVPVGGLVILAYLWAQPPVDTLADETLPA